MAEWRGTAAAHDLLPYAGRVSAVDHKHPNSQKPQGGVAEVRAGGDPGAGAGGGWRSAGGAGRVPLSGGPQLNRG